ncbi:MAG: DUF3784 domain-containing protein [Defluviitaleaceae bacterium]|nr:DUF3784 domain-containing protein [Defluviitaleaceae bacterium]
MQTMFTWILVGLAGLLAVMGGLWFIGRGAWLMNGYNSMDKEKKERIDEKKFLRFNGQVTLVAALMTGVFALLNHFGVTWAFGFGMSGVIVMAGVNIYSMRSKRFLKSDAPELAPDSPKKAKERKAKLVMAVIATVVLAIPLGWIMIEGTRPIRATVTASELQIRGFYGRTVALDDILEVHLYEQSMLDIGTGGRRAGHSSPNNLRGSFRAGHLIVQGPDEGPTIRIERRGDTTIFISKANASDTRSLYNQLINAMP